MFATFYREKAGKYEGQFQDRQKTKHQARPTTSPKEMAFRNNAKIHLDLRFYTQMTEKDNNFNSQTAITYK